VEVGADKSVPFWKKEISLKRASKAGVAPVEAPLADEAGETPVPFWKKDLSVKRKPKRAEADDLGAADVPAFEDESAEKKPSIWKRELSFGRKAKTVEADEPVAEALPALEAEEPVEKKPSIWKRELSLGRKAKTVEADEPVAEAMLEDEPPVEKKPSLWKRELSLGRKAKAVEADEPAAEALPALEEEQPAEKKPSLWKRELSFGRKRKPEPDAESEPAGEDEEDSWRRDLIFGSTQPAADAETAIEPEPLPEPVFFELPAEIEGGAEADAHAEPSEEDEPEAPVEVLPSWAAPHASSISSAYGWLTDDLEPVDLASTSWAGTQPPTLPEPPKASPREPEPEPDPAPEPAPEPELEAEPETAPEPELEIEPETEAEIEPEPIAETPRLETVPLPAPRVEIHPPVTAAELPPLPEAEADKKPSFLKRDLSFRRKPKAAPEPVDETPAEDGGGEPAEKTSLLRRELSFGRKPKAERAERKPKRRRKDRGTAAPVAGAPADEAEAAKPAKERRRGKGANGKGHKKLVGLKIGASQLAAARVHNNGSAQLVQLARQDLDAGVVVGGELRDPEALAQALKEFFKKHKLPKTGVRLGIANNRIGVRSFDLAGIEDPKQLANAIRFRAQEALPIPIEEAVLDYRVLGETVDEEGATSRRILLVVAYRDLVDRYVDACRKAGIKLVGIDLEAFALLRALSAPPEDEDYVAEAATVAVAIGHERSTFAVSDGRVCEFTRVLEWGGSSLNVAIARALDLSPSEAEPIKRELSLAAETEVEGLDADQVAQAREAVMRQVQGFARELVSSLQFYQGQPGSLGIAEIAITGGTAHLPGLAAELERLIGVRVRVADPLARVRVGKKVADGDQVGSLAVAIGLGIDD
jgi:type IV pilus assembly protein PilM